MCVYCLAGDVAQASDGSYVCDCCLAALVGYPFICWAMTRGRIRERDEIPGNCCFDLVETLLCPCCVLIQELNHLDIRREERAKTQTTVTIVQQTPVPQAPQPMVMGSAPQMGGYPVQGYPQPMQQPMGYPPQVMPYPQQPMGYPQQGGYPMPPQGGYPGYK